MQKLMKTVVPFGSGTYTFKEDTFRVWQLRPFLRTISMRIQGRLGRRVTGKKQKIILSSVTNISIATLLVAIRIQGTRNGYDQFQIVTLHLDPLKQRLNWTHVVTFDSFGATDIFDRRNIRDHFRFDCRMIHASVQDSEVPKNVYLCLNWERCVDSQDKRVKNRLPIKMQELAVKPQGRVFWKGTMYQQVSMELS